MRRSFATAEKLLVSTMRKDLRISRSDMTSDSYINGHCIHLNWNLKGDKVETQGQSSFRHRRFPRHWCGNCQAFGVRGCERRHHLREGCECGRGRREGH